jgi:hypothetical protein
LLVWRQRSAQEPWGRLWGRLRGWQMKSSLLQSSLERKLEEKRLETSGFYEDCPSCLTKIKNNIILSRILRCLFVVPVHTVRVLYLPKRSVSVSCVQGHMCTIPLSELIRM